MESYEEKVARQKQNEMDSRTLGIARYRKEMREESEGAPGRSLLKAYVLPVARAIGEFIDAAASGKAGRKHVALKYLAHIDPLQAAYIATRCCLDSTPSGVRFTITAASIGNAIREHVEMTMMAKDHPGLYRKVSRQLARSTSSKHRLGVLRHIRDKYDLNTLAWTDADKVLIGSKLIELVLASTDLFEIVRMNHGPKDRPHRLVFTAKTAEWLSAAHGRCELQCPVHLPMIVPPRQWKTPYAGGYLTSLLRPRLIHSRNPHYLDEIGGVDLTPVLSAVNAIQATPWRINRPVWEVMHEEIARGGNSAGLPRTSDIPLPPLPPNAPPRGTKAGNMTAQQAEDMTAWKGEAARVHEANAKLRQERAALACKLYVADRFVDEPEIYFPHHLDFRGRVYPLGSYLNPQSDDIGRGLLEFGNGKPLGEDGAFWLAVHIAGLWGVDKVSFEDRVAWVQEHEDRILLSALEPHNDDAFWREAEKPWQALAACIDWLGYSVNGADHISHTPIAMDGSCSGLQHYSALLRDPIGGAAVNLVPAEKPADIYTSVAKRAQVLSDGCLGGTNDAMARAWQGRFVRKVAKQPTMTLCYSATKYGMRKQIENALLKADREGSPLLPQDVDRFQASLYAADIIWTALADTVVAASGAMTWLQQVSELMTEAELPLRWVSPIGLPVLQDYREENRSRVKVHIGGRPVQLDVLSPSDRLSLRRQGSGVAPNFVHSLDGAHLLSTVNLSVLNGITDFAVIHDSFATHAANTTLLNAVLREAFVDQYSAPILAPLRGGIVDQLVDIGRRDLADRVPPLPPFGALDLEAVRNSEFFFA